MPRSVEEFIQSLEKISHHGGKAYARAYLVFESEEEHAQAILRYKGYLALSDAFKCFYLETVEAMNTGVRHRVTKPLSEYYGLMFPRLTHSFMTLCGAERIATRGYPYQGYTLLRNVFDTLLMSSAALQKLVTFYDLDGIVPGETSDKDVARKRRRATEFDVAKKMMGSASGLSSGALAELKIWDAMFDYETHGARLSATHAVEWMKGRAPLAALPRFEERAWAIFSNRAIEVSWMLLRLLPNIQPDEARFDQAWIEKWEILDLSYREMVSALTEQMGKRIGAALVELVDKKFPFTARSAFPL